MTFPVPLVPPVVPLRLAVIGAGPVGLALALHAAQALPAAEVHLFDARPLPPGDADDRGDATAAAPALDDPRTLALSLGSVQLLQRLGAWNAAAAQAIAEVHVSQQPPSLPPLPRWLAGRVAEPAVRIRAVDEAVPLLGAVLGYGAIVAPLRRAWRAACEREPARLIGRFGTPVASLKALPGADGVEVDAGIVERFDLAVLAEGGVFGAPNPGAAPSMPRGRGRLHRDYGQTAWVGTVTLRGGRRGVAYERFTRHGPAALLPLSDVGDGAGAGVGADSATGSQARPASVAEHRAALVWCVPRDDDPVRDLTDAQRLAVLATLFAAEAGEPVALSPLKEFALGLSAERTLTDGRVVRIGNAAQMLHPVAGQGLNLGLRDAFELVAALAGVVAGDGAARTVDAALRRLEWQRAGDRWSLIAATDFLARSFTWQLPGAGAARGLGLAALQAVAPLKSALTRQMMFGVR